MKKLLGIIVFIFFWCNASSAEYMEFRKCYFSKYKNFDEAARLSKAPLFDKVITINTDAGTVTRTIIRSKEDAEKLTEILSSLAGQKIKTSKIQQNIFNIQTYAAGMITAEGFIGEKTDQTVFKIKQFIDISNRTIEQKITSYYDGEVIMESETSLKCAEDFSAESDENEASGSSGTAFFINGRGNLLTNNHVVEGCKLSKISYKNKDYEAKLIATDKTLDLALLKVDVKPKTFFTFSKDEAKKLNKVYVAGYPLGKGLSDDLKISSGIVSSLKGFEDNSNEIQIDAPINPGNSGGPIINENGDLIAIAVSGMAKDQTEGINFGIKSSAAEIFLRSNNISLKKSMYGGVKENDKLLEILEEGTVYTYCD